MMKTFGAPYRILVFFLAMLLPAGKAGADILNGTMELEYSTFDTSSKDASGTVSQSRSADLSQRYGLSMDVAPLPTLKVFGGVVFTKDAGDFSSPNGDLHSSVTTLSPTVTLSLQDPFRIYGAEVGYGKLEQTASSQNSPAMTTVSETYHASFNWKPVDLPPLGILLSRTNNYDLHRTSQDSTTDSVLMSSRYKPLPGIDTAYSVGYTDGRDHLTGLEVQSLLQSGKVNYAGQYWGQRGSFSTGYTIGVRSTDTSLRGSGEVSFQLYPITGLSSVTDTPTTDTLSPNAALIDGNLTASANINIGASLSVSGDTKQREMGLDFYAVTEVSNVLIWVNEQLPPTIANSFAWDIYTSSDNLNWTLLQTVFPAPFGPFLNRFSLDFQNVKTRYLKVLTRPLGPAVQGATDPTYQNIFVTEMQAFLNRPAADVRGVSSQLYQAYNLGTRTQLLASPGLYHDFAFNLSESSGTATPLSRRYSLSNGLSLLHRFNPVFTGNARVGWDDSADQSGAHSDAYSYSAVLNAAPLQTLRGSLVYGGQAGESNGRSSESNSMSLSTTAALYTGINWNASGSMSTSSAGGVNSRSTGFQTGASLVPNQRLSVNISFGTTHMVSSGDAQASGTAATSSRWELDTVFRPFETMYLTASISRLDQTNGAPVTLRNFGLNWSPLFSGTLQCSYLYSENLRVETDAKETISGPSLTWMVFPRASLTLSYATIEDDSPTLTQQSRSFSALYKMTL